jgi:lipopolysaccharide/colanic/teichoic acid biosynthesis glycosyltransferase
MPPASSAGLYPDRARRLLNVVVAAILLLLVTPLMIVIAVLIKLTSPGPIFYTQTRVGLDRRRSRPPVQDGRRRIDYGGNLFTMFKFRTMYLEADRLGEVWAQPDDPRVTPVGRVLRRYRLDELPQLINVLLGDMNIVGPRPEQPKIFSDLRDQIERYPVRQAVLPGITGWAQINHHYDQSLDDVQRKLGYDLEYVERHSALEDLRIMLRTVPVVVFKQGGW